MIKAKSNLFLICTKLKGKVKKNMLQKKSKKGKKKVKYEMCDRNSQKKKAKEECEGGLCLFFSLSPLLTFPYSQEPLLSFSLFISFAHNLFVTKGVLS